MRFEYFLIKLKGGQLVTTSNAMTKNEAKQLKEMAESRNDGFQYVIKHLKDL